MTDEVCEVIITAPDAEWLAEFTRSLVEDRLAASGHNITPIRSIYRWQGHIYDKPEARVALHTRRSLLGRIVERTNRDHPYEVPCVAAMTFDGNPAYVQWVLDETITPE
jgi:periplasmic divalent cation tolerance protein